MFSSRVIVFTLLSIMIYGCGDNLIPSGEDKRPSVTAGTSGGGVSQKATDFSVPSTSGSTVTLSSSLAGKKGAVFYFTMWCPICDSHQSNMRTSVVPSYPDVNFYLVDYVSGSVSAAENAASASGYTDFTILADISRTMLGLFGATMGTTIVIDKDGVVRMNEDYRDGKGLLSVLSAL